MGLLDLFKKKDSGKAKRKAALRHVMLGSTLAANKQYDDAASMFKAGIERDDGCAEAHYGLGLMFAKKGDENEAKREYEIAAKLNPSIKAELDRLGIPYEKEFNIIEELQKGKGDG